MSDDDYELNRLKGDRIIRAASRPGRRGPDNFAGHVVISRFYQGCTAPVPPDYRKIHEDKIMNQISRVEQEMERLGIMKAHKQGKRNRGGRPRRIA